MVDTGAESNNYITPETAVELKRYKVFNNNNNDNNNIEHCNYHPTKICGAINNCHINNKCFELKLHIYNDSNKKDFYRLPNNLNISINNARIVEGLPYDIIIGLPTVRK